MPPQRPHGKESHSPPFPLGKGQERLVLTRTWFNPINSCVKQLLSAEIHHIYRFFVFSLHPAAAEGSE